ncbi:alkaline phosphatase D family protein [Pelagicoccus sp. SDUM812003]|uniref:alkaline phosphatase D family protein n=1 Tax=Pelagicoccus sp. SDUM812003 TaxID=3041267 RepID=UPI0028107770|nr:alkaline phosphatase D family protein [Pelagicoccus sp. SDUM812003]MDQ8205128.1 alkaline phosphatase D family protein [Pelagicoccus sp. SDUM812003]
MFSKPIRTATLALGLAASLISTAIAGPQLMQGPMLGHVTPDSARIWARVAGDAEFTVQYSKSANFENAKTTAPVRASEENDFCVEAIIEDLEPSSFYYYQVLVDGQPLSSAREKEGYPFLTAPSEEMPVRFSIAFGAGAKTEIDGMQAIWLQVQNARPHLFFWLGDNESAEGLSPAFQAEQYRKQRGIPFLQPLLRSIPQLATWDGAGRSEPKSLDVFRRYWANPSYGTSETPGSFFKHSYGGVDFFVLDTYSFRKQGQRPTLLGQEQLDWVKDELSRSEAPFKVLLSSSSWTDIKESSASTWMAFPQERNELLSYIKSEEIPGVMLISGDNDQAEVKAIPMSDVGGYDLYELVSSPLAQDPTASFDAQDPSTITIHEPYSATMNFGLLTFDMTQQDPQMSFEIINVFGESVFPTLEVQASELTNGTASWQTKVDDPQAFAYADEAPAAPSEATIR